MVSAVAIVVLTLYTHSHTAHAGLVASWSFSGNADDSSGNNLNGVVSGATLVADRFGTANSAYSFDNTDDYIEVANTGGLLTLTNAYSLAAWVNPNNAGTSFLTSNPIIWKLAEPGNNRDNYAMAYRNSSFGFGSEEASTDNDYGVFSEPHAPQNWYFVTAVYNQGIQQIYVNGVLEGTNDIGKNIVPYQGAGPLRIGNLKHASGHSGAGVFDGLIDDVAIFDHALTQLEISALGGFSTVPEPSHDVLLLLTAVVAAVVARRRGSARYSNRPRTCCIAFSRSTGMSALHTQQSVSCLPEQKLSNSPKGSRTERSLLNHWNRDPLQLAASPQHMPAWLRLPRSHTTAVVMALIVSTFSF